jgi:L-fuconolactonase
MCPPPASPPSPHLAVRPDWLATTREEALEPDRVIIDPHHHLWDRPDGRYLLPQFAADLATGHRVAATVYIEALAHYHAGGDPLLRPLGEIAYAAGVAAEAATSRPSESSDSPGMPAVCAGIVGTVDLQAGDRVRELLEAAIETGRGHLRGIRVMTVSEMDPASRGSMVNRPPGMLTSAAFQAGFAHLAPLGLSFDAWLYHTQHDELIALADAFADTTIVLNHVGGFNGLGRFAARRAEVFETWRDGIRRIAQRPNVCVKLGGLGQRLFGFDAHTRPTAPTSQVLAELWRPHIETCIEAFGPGRAMFESNFPVDKGTCSYVVLWNAFKRIAAAMSPAEKHALFAGTAARVYRLTLRP